jgi:AraC-like DNA-binding protein
MEPDKPGPVIRWSGSTAQRTPASLLGAIDGSCGSSSPTWLEEWRIVARERYNWDLQPVSSKPGPRQFVCEYSALGEGDARFLHSRAMAAVVRPFDAARARLRLVFLLSGRARIQACAGNATVEVGRGDLFLLDTAAVREVQWSAHSDLCLQLPEYCRRMRPDLEAGTRAVIPINDAVIAKPLKAMLRLLASRGGDLDATTRERTLQSLVDMTMLGLSSPPLRVGPTHDDRDSPLVKAQRYLRSNFHRTDLSVDEVATAMACSRTTLYRLFAASSLTVMGYLRETRLQRCRAALAASPAQANIGRIAYQHGFIDLHAFTRLFKRRFGVTPGQVRDSQTN